jgi:hypothetical protein
MIYLSPQGRRLDQALVLELAQEPALVLLAGRYEGIDERLFARHAIEEVSIGDFVLSGGELPAMVLLDAVIRQIPGALGHADSAEREDSFADGLLDCPHYTRPETYLGLNVPDGAAQRQPRRGGALAPEAVVAGTGAAAGFAGTADPEPAGSWNCSASSPGRAVRSSIRVF